MANSLTVQDLFTPMPSGVGPFGSVSTSPPLGTWLGIALATATQIGLPTTAWVPDSPEPTILATESVLFSMSDVNISIIAQGGFLQSAASGSVTYTALDGTSVTIPVTPDPSNPAQNPTGAPGWLDLLAQQEYGQTRLTATAATGPLAIANTRGGTLGPYSPGTYHAGNAVSGATYSNASSLTIPSSIIGGGGGTVTSVSPGLTSTAISTSGPHGLSVNSTVYIVISPTSGITGLNGIFAIVTSATSNAFQIAVGSSGTYTSGGTIYAPTVATMTADKTGIGSNAAPGTVTVPITANAGTVLGNVVGWSGSNWESNGSLAQRCVDSLAAASPNGPSQAYKYFAETAAQFFTQVSPPSVWTIRNPPYTLTNGPVRATEYSNPQTGIVVTVVGSTTPASTVLGQAVTPGVVQLPVSGVSNANPAVVTTSGPNSLGPGQTMTVTIAGVLGTLGVNGTFLATYVAANQFSIPVDTTAAGTYTGGGAVEGGDLGQIDLLLQQNVVPDGITAITESAVALPINIVATVLVPQANYATYVAAYGTQLLNELANYAIGGNLDANGNSLPVSYNDIVGALEEAGVLVQGQPSVATVMQLSLNGGGVGVNVPFPDRRYEAILGTVSVTVVTR